MKSIKYHEESDINAKETEKEKFDFAYENRDLAHDFKMYFRLYKRLFKSFVREKTNRTFTNVLFLTTDCPGYIADSKRLDSPLCYINEMRKQYPNTEIRIMLPIIGLSENIKPAKKIYLEVDGFHKVLEKTSIHFEYFIKNETYNCALYRILTEDSNVTLYGLWSPAFSYIKSDSNIEKFEYINAYLRASRIAIQRLINSGFLIDIVHSDKLPFFCGTEFETKMLSKIKVIQNVDDFALQDSEKQDAFWALINLADKRTIKRICRDNYIKTCISDLFNINPANFSNNMTEYLDVIYKNYSSFVSYSKTNTKQKGEIIFDRLNNRIIKMFPELFDKNDKYFYPMLNSIKKASYWLALSNSYHKDLPSNNKMPVSILNAVRKTYEKSSYFVPQIDVSNTLINRNKSLYNSFDINNFRNERKYNKSILIKEFSSDRIKTDFIDKSIFKNQDGVIEGYLDGFYEAPLLFASAGNDLFGYGIDILYSVVLKMLEINKNFQIIISVPNGLNSDYIKTRIDFMKEHKEFNGRWVYVNTEVNLPKIFSAADIFLIPYRENFYSLEHLMAMSYGCIPVAAKYGLLDDTINDVFDNICDCNGFKTTHSLWSDNAAELYFKTLDKAIDLYKNNASGWNVIVKNALNKNFGYDFNTLEQYNKIYQEVLYL